MSNYVVLTVIGLMCAVNTTAEEGAKFKGQKLFVASSAARDWVDLHKNDRPNTDAKLIYEKIASQPQCIWITSSDLTHVEKGFSAATKNEIVPLVMYNIPKRDSGQYSAGGEGSPENYKKSIDALAKIIGSRKALIAVEPDALMLIDDLPEKDREMRYSLIQYAVRTLKKNPTTYAYLDGGHSHWHSAEKTAEHLKRGGVEIADGFVLNTSNFREQKELIAFGQKVSGLLNGKHFMIDTSRNGNGPWTSTDPEAWCNPPGRALGINPTFDTKHPLIDAFLWIKHPGESDGACRGGPKAGTFWPEYALELIKNRK
jgi:endoglucanase